MRSTNRFFSEGAGAPSGHGTRRFKSGPLGPGTHFGTLIPPQKRVPQVSLARVPDDRSSSLGWSRPGNHRCSRQFERKLRYIYRNLVARGLVSKPEEWPWSSFRHDLTGEHATVEIESFWTAAARSYELPESFETSKTQG